MADNEVHNKRRVYGRRQGRPLKSSRTEVLESLLPSLSLPAEQLSGNADIRPGSWFSDPANPVWMEIGFGNGEHLAGLMRRSPQCNYIGAEPFINGMAAFLKEIRECNKDNIRVHMDDAMQLVHSLADDSLAGIYILNPDPWPKKRHHKRRMVSADNLDAFARVIKPGGTLTMTTDVDDLAEWMLTRAFTHPGFEWKAESKKDWASPPPQWIGTRYEQKGREQGRHQTYLIFERTTP